MILEKLKCILTFKWLQELDLHDILSFDVDLGKILQEMHALVRRKQYLESLPGDNQKQISNLCFRGAPIEDLCLDFTLPGYPDYVLKPGGENTMVCNFYRPLSIVFRINILYIFTHIYTCIYTYRVKL